MGGHYFATAAGAAGVFAADFFTAFLCFFAVFAVVVAAGLLAPFEAGAGAGVCADIKAMLPKARAIVITVVFILFSPCGPFSISRSQSHLAPDRPGTR
jgi:hypothetical protein